MQVFLNTVVAGSTRDGTSGKITALSAVQRVPVGHTTGWEQLTSSQLQDWYSPEPSPAFDKISLQFTNFTVVVDATEFGDVLATSGVTVAQGIESPTENSTTYIDYCGQAATIPLFMEYTNEVQPNPGPVPVGSNESLPFSLGADTWARIWTYRRVLADPNSTLDTVLPGEISNQASTQCIVYAHVCVRACVHV